MTADLQTVELSAAEWDALAECEAAISRGLRTFAEMGRALAVVRDSRLYRATHATFEEYCADRWQLSKPYATRLIQATTVLELITVVPIGTKPGRVLPTTESQARPLARLLPAEDAPTKIRETWAQAVESAPLDADGRAKVTAKHVEEVVNRRLSKPIATPIPARKQSRRPLPDAFRDAAHDLLKAAERVERLTTDTRFARNAPQIARSCHRDLSRSAELLAAVVSRVSNPTEGE